MFGRSVVASSDPDSQMADFDFWNVTTYNGVSQTESETIFLVIICIILTILAIFINGCLILVIWKSKLLQTCTNMFILSLLMSELLAGGLGSFASGLFRLHQQLGQGIITCEAIGFFQTFGRFTSMISLMLVCIDRVVAVKRPLRYMYLMSPRSTTVFIFYAWIHGLVLALMPYFGFAKYLYHSNLEVCVYASHRTSGHIVKEMFAFILPTFVIIVSVFVIVKEANCHRRVFAIVPIPTLAATIIPHQNIYRRWGTFRSMRGFFLILAGYTVLCFPYHISRLVHGINSTMIPSQLLKLTLWLSFFSCLLNPIFIALSNKRFKTRCKQVVMCRKIRTQPENDAFNVSTGLHSAIEAPMVAGFLPKKGDRMLIKHIGERRSRLENAALLLRLSTVSNPVTLRSIRHSFDQNAGQSVARDLPIIQ